MPKKNEPTLNLEVTKYSLVETMNTCLKEYRKEMNKALSLVYVNNTGGISIIDSDVFNNHIKKMQDAERYFQNAADRMRYYNNLEEN